MAKKARKKLEDEEADAFEFPVFDDASFVKKEFELAAGLTIAGLLAVGLGLVAWALTFSGVPWWGPILLGLVGVIATPIVISRLRSRSTLYTKGDWAGLIFLVFFGYLAVWFLLVNLVVRAS
jgi:hypothetical protein